MSDFPSLTEIASEHNLLVDYIKYVDKCIDQEMLPMKYQEWIWYADILKYTFELL